MNQLPPAFWSISVTEMLQKLETAKDGLTGDEAGRRLARYGAIPSERRGNPYNKLTGWRLPEVFSVIVSQTTLIPSFLRSF
jgi:hypothetical protein